MNKDSQKREKWGKQWGKQFDYFYGLEKSRLRSKNSVCLY
jgi:hypothetical protein